MAESLAWLRPIDSIWWAWVQRYLLAADIPKMDLFHWSEDTTNLPAGLVRDLLELTLENKLTEPEALETLDTPVDLGAIKIPAYLLAGKTDNLTPWRSCYRTATMLGSKCRFVLVNGGHLQAILRPPGGRQAGFRTGTDTPARRRPLAPALDRPRRQLVGPLPEVAQPPLERHPQRAAPGWRRAPPGARAGARQLRAPPARRLS